MSWGEEEGGLNRKRGKKKRRKGGRGHVYGRE